MSDLVEILGEGYTKAQDTFRSALASAPGVTEAQAKKLTDDFNQVFSSFIDAAGKSAQASAVAITLGAFSDILEKDFKFKYFLTEVETAKSLLTKQLVRRCCCFKRSKRCFFELNKNVEKGGFDFKTFTDTYKDFIAATRFAPVSKFGDNFEVSKRLRKFSSY